MTLGLSSVYAFVMRKALFVAVAALALFPSAAFADGGHGHSSSHHSSTRYSSHNSYRPPVCPLAKYDLNHNGVIDVIDISLAAQISPWFAQQVADNFGKTVFCEPPH